MILELSGGFNVKLLCETMGIRRSSFYNWKKHLSNLSRRTRSLVNSILLFQEYHLKYPSHGYRWLNAKIRLDTGLVLSDPYAHKCCKAAEIKSGVRRCKYKKSGEPFKVFPNLLMTEMRIDAPLQCIVSDMTAFKAKGICHELTLYMDLWNNEIVSHSLSSKRGDRMTYISGLEDLLALKEQHLGFEGFRVRSMKGMNALNRYLSYAIGLLCLLAEKHACSTLRMAVMCAAKAPRKEKDVRFLLYRLGLGVCMVLAQAREGIRAWYHIGRPRLQTVVFLMLC